MRNFKEFIPIKGGEYDLSIGTYDIAAFEIGKYPVVNRWFGEFVSGKGYEKLDWWSENGSRWLVKEKPNHPRYWHDAEWNAPDCPVVGVCWYEAEAFCNWLTQTLSDGYTYRLPTEMEWEAAAAGFEKRIYPWGDEWDESLCNTYEAGIGKTSKVGRFKLGNTPEGVCDMAGNVWEWTNSGEEKWWVLRGGSLVILDVYLRCDLRFWYIPSGRDDDAGFRCIRTEN